LKLAAVAVIVCAITASPDLTAGRGLKRMIQSSMRSALRASPDLTAGRGLKLLCQSLP